MNVLVEETLNRLVEEIENGTGDWRKTWASGGMPRNWTTRKNYSGANVLLLWCARERAGYATQEWATYKQWAAAGYQVKAGEKSSVILIVKDASDKKATEETGEQKFYKMFKCAFVFNAAQLIEQPAELTAPRAPVSIEDRHKNCEWRFLRTGARLVTSYNGAHYTLALDVIGMPAIDLFDGADSYYSVLFHELIHWTGHGSRLARIETGAKGKTYAAEELVAELGAAFLCAEHGITEVYGLDNSAAYLRNWLSYFKDDKAGALLKAASAASKAYSLVMDGSPVSQSQAA